jgi:hypothetical protein
MSLEGLVAVEDMAATAQRARAGTNVEMEDRRDGLREGVFWGEITEL